MYTNLLSVFPNLQNVIANIVYERRRNMKTRKRRRKNWTNKEEKKENKEKKELKGFKAENE